jgi:hypothetical protein
MKRRPDGMWRARYRDLDGREHTRHFERKVDGQRWLDERTSALLAGRQVDPKTARTTVQDWCATWLDGYGTRRRATVRQARVHVAQIVAEFGPLPLAVVRQSQVRAWGTRLGEQGYATSTVYALHPGCRKSCPTPCTTGSCRGHRARSGRRRPGRGSGPTS